jgi:hypothetical protein
MVLPTMTETMMTSPQVGLGRWCGAMALGLALLLVMGTTTQAQTNDFQTWISAGIKTDLSKRFSAGFQPQLRLTDNSTSVGSILLEPEVGFRVNKYLKLGLGYRFTIRPGSDHVNSTAHRLNLDVEGKKKFGNLGLSLRLRIQQGFQDPYVNENRAPYSAPTYNRNKLSVEYKVSKLWTPFVEGEVFFPLNDPRHRGLDRYRVTLGSAFNLKNRNAVDVFVRLQQEVYTANPETAYILGLGYTYDLKLPKGKKKKKDKEKDKTKD